MAATGKVIGTVTAVVGEAKATAADGTVRILQIGDKVHSDEAISTSEAGSIQIALEGGKTLACEGGAELALHESLLNVANAPASSDVDAIQRAIAAGEDPSLVAAATAAGGAPAAGGDVDGGSHEPVILEQSNEASVVTSGFETAGDSFTFTEEEVESLLAAVIEDSTRASPPAAPSAPEVPAQISQSDTPSAIVDVVVPELPVELPQAAPILVASGPDANDDASEGTSAAIVVEQRPVVSGPSDETFSNEAPIVVETGDEQRAVQQPPIVNEQRDDAPVVIAEQPHDTPVVTVEQGQEETPSEPVASLEEPAHSNDEPVIVETSNEEQQAQPPVVNEQTEETEVVVSVEETPSSPSQPSSPVASSISYSISANTNQDEQIGFLTFSNAGNKFQTLVFFGQEGQQKPTAVQLSFTLDPDQPMVVELEYVDAFAGHSDANTGKTAQKIAIKDFSLDLDGTNLVLAEEKDGVNLGVVGKKSQMLATVEANADGTVGDWSFGNPPAAINSRVSFDGAADDTDGGIDILDVTSASLDLSNVGDLPKGYEVLNLKGAAAQELTLKPEDVLNMTDGVLHILGGKEDTLNLSTSDGWTVASNQTTHFGWVQVTNGTATLLVDPDVNINLMG